MEVLDSTISLQIELVAKLEEYGFVEVAHTLEEELWDQSGNKSVRGFSVKLCDFFNISFINLIRDMTNHGAIFVA